MLFALFAKDAEVGTNITETYEDLFPGVGERFDSFSCIPLPRENADDHGVENCKAPSSQPVPLIPEDFAVEGEAQIEIELPPAAAPKSNEQGIKLLNKTETVEKPTLLKKPISTQRGEKQNTDQNVNLCSVRLENLSVMSSRRVNDCPSEMHFSHLVIYSLRESGLQDISK